MIKEPVNPKQLELVSDKPPTQRVGQWRRVLNLLTSPALAVLVFFLSLYFLTGTYFTKGVSDGEVMAQTAVALAERHSVELAANPGLPQIVPGKNGHYFSKYGLGQPLLAAGLYDLGQIFTRRLMPKADAVPVGHFFMMLLPVIATALTVWLVYLWGKQLYNSVGIGLGLALLYGLGTSAWPYTKVFFSEALFTFGTFGAAFALWQARRILTSRTRYAWFILAGFLLGYSLLTKVSGLILLPIYLWYTVYGKSFTLNSLQSKGTDSSSRFGGWWRNFGGRVWDGGLGPLFLGLLPGLAMILLHNYLRFGSPFNNGYDQEQFSTPLWQGLGGLLFSPGKSLFLYSPVLLALPFAVGRFWRRARAEASLFGLISGATLLYYSLWWAWEGGWSWGPRFLVPLLPMLVLPLGALLAQPAARKRGWLILLFGLLLPLGIVVQMLGVALDANTYMIALANNPALPADYYIWNFSASPLLEHWSHLWQAPYNQIRGLTLDQLGFRPAIGFTISLLVTILLIISGISLVVSYLKTRRALNHTET